MHAVEKNKQSQVLSACLVVAILWAAQAFLIPTALALLFSFVGGRTLELLAKRGFGLKISVAFLSAVVVLTFVLGTWILGQQILEISNNASIYRANLSAKTLALESTVDNFLSKFRIATYRARGVGRGAIVISDPPVGSRSTLIASTPPVSKGPQVGEMFSGLQENVPAFVHFIGISAFIIVFALFLSVYRDDIRDRIIRLAGERNVYLTSEMLNEIGSKVSIYLWTQFSINAVYGISLSAIFFVLSLKYALLWGMLIGLLRFVPFVGIFLGATFPFLFALADDSGWISAWLVIGAVISTDFLITQFVEPHVIGRKIGLSPIAVLLSAFFWTLVWGIPGLVIATPFSACLVVAGRYFQPLEFATILFSDEPALNPGIQLYRRALTQFDLNADAWLQSFINSTGITQYLTLALFPSLRMLSRDKRRGQFTRRRMNQICKVLKSSLNSSDHVLTPSDAKVSPTQTILLLPLRDEIDGVMVRGIANFIRNQFDKGLKVRAVTKPITVKRIVEILEKIEPTIAIICGMSSDQKDSERLISSIHFEIKKCGSQSNGIEYQTKHFDLVILQDGANLGQRKLQTNFPVLSSLSELESFLGKRLNYTATPNESLVNSSIRPERVQAP